MNIRANTASVTVGAIKKKKLDHLFLFLADLSLWFVLQVNCKPCKVLSDLVWYADHVTLKSFFKFCSQLLFAKFLSGHRLISVLVMFHLGFSFRGKVKWAHIVVCSLLQWQSLKSSGNQVQVKLFATGVEPASKQLLIYIPSNIIILLEVSTNSLKKYL